MADKNENQASQEEIEEWQKENLNMQDEDNPDGSKGEEEDE